MIFRFFLLKSYLYMNYPLHSLVSLLCLKLLEITSQMLKSISAHLLICYCLSNYIYLSKILSRNKCSKNRLISSNISNVNIFFSFKTSPTDLQFHLIGAERLMMRGIIIRVFDGQFTINSGSSNCYILTILFVIIFKVNIEKVFVTAGDSLI